MTTSSSKAPRWSSSRTGVAWTGYEVTPAQRDRVKPFVLTYVVLKAVLVAVFVGVEHFRGSDTAFDVVAVPIAVLLVSYLLDMFVLTRGLPRTLSDLETSKDICVGLARKLPIRIVYIFFGLKL